MHLQSQARRIDPAIKKNITTAICAVLSVIGSALASSAGTQVVAWGSNFYNETNVPAGLSNIIQVSAYGHNGSALRATGIPVQWGSITNDPSHKVPTSLTNAVVIAAGSDPYNLALTSDGRIVGWGGMIMAVQPLQAGQIVMWRLPLDTSIAWE
jgi:hypothetical protein